jgi:signal transduction histidine kinase
VIDVQCVQGQLCFTIDDDGPGIPEEEREHMFERGVQLDEQRPGSGLGLDIVRALAETYGGSVQALASPLGGARLCLRLPAAVEA